MKLVNLTSAEGDNEVTEDDESITSNNPSWQIVPHNNGWGKKWVMMYNVDILVDNVVNLNEFPQVWFMLNSRS